MDLKAITSGTAVTAVKRAAVGTSLLGAAALAGLGLGGGPGRPVPVAHADAACGALLAPHVAFLKNNPSSWVDVKLASSEDTRFLVSYTRAALVSRGTAPSGAPLLATQTGYPGNGDGKQYFDDRRYPTAPNGPFDASATDALGVAIDSATGAMTLTLRTWGGARIDVPVTQCAKGVLYGFSTTSPNTLWTAIFRDVQAPG